MIPRDVQTCLIRHFIKTMKNKCHKNEKDIEYFPNTKQALIDDLTNLKPV